MKAQLDPHLIAKTGGNANPNQIYISGRTRIRNVTMLITAMQRYG